MDVLRAALGDAEAQLPRQVLRHLPRRHLRRPVPHAGRPVRPRRRRRPRPQLDAGQPGQAEGFERATRAYVADCVKRGDCPLGGSVDAGDAAAARLPQAARRPADPRRRPARVRADRGLGDRSGSPQAMYDQGSWGSADRGAAVGLRQGDGDDLMPLADSYAERSHRGALQRQPDARSSTPSTASTARTARTWRTTRARPRRSAAGAPTWGPFLAWSTVPVRLLAGARPTTRRRRSPPPGSGADRRRRHDPRPRDALRVVQAAAPTSSPTAT